MASQSSMSSMSKVRASLLRKEVAEGVSSIYAGTGMPRTIKKLSAEEIADRRRQLDAYEASRPAGEKRQSKWTRKLGAIEADTKAIKKDTEAIRGTTQAILEDTKFLRNVFEGGEQPRKDGQSDKERIKQLRVQKRIIDNEIGDLREREGKRSARS